MIELKNISLNYQDKLVLDNVSLKIQNNGLYLITGESGVGKTTLLNILANIETKYRGNRHVTGDITQVFADYKLFDNLSVYDNLKLVSSTDEIDRYLAFFKIQDLKKVKVKYLSGGEKQRVALIRSLLMDSKIMLLDEITSSLDYDNALFLMQYLKELSNKKIIIVISHDNRFNELFDTIYQLSDTKLSIIKNDVTKNNVSNEKNKVKKSLLLIAFKNMVFNFRHSIISNAMIFLVLFFLSFICFFSVPTIISNFEEVQQNYNTTTFYLDVSIYDENASGYHEYYLEEIAKLEGFVDFNYVHNISEFIAYDQVYLNDMYLNYNYLTYYNNKNVQHLNEITDIVVSPTYTNNMAIYDSIGSVPSNENEIAIGSDFAILYFDTTNMQEVVGKSIELTFMTSTGSTYQKTYKITGVYESPYQEFDTIYGQIDGKNTLLLNSIQLYHPKYNELSPEQQQEITTLIPLKDVNDGYYSFSFTMKTANVTDDLITQIEAINDTDIVSVQKNTNEESLALLKENIIFFTTIIIAGVILCVAASFINMRYRKQEYAKYYLCGYKTSNVTILIILEYLLYTIITLPLVIITTYFLYNYFIEDLIYTNLNLVILIIIFIIIAIVIITSFIVGFINRQKKALSNLKGEL